MKGVAVNTESVNVVGLDGPSISCIMPYVKVVKVVDF